MGLDELLKMRIIGEKRRESRSGEEKDKAEFWVVL